MPVSGTQIEKTQEKRDRIDDAMVMVAAAVGALEGLVDGLTNLPPMPEGEAPEVQRTDANLEDHLDAMPHRLEKLTYRIHAARDRLRTGLIG